MRRMGSQLRSFEDVHKCFPHFSASSRRASAAVFGPRFLVRAGIVRYSRLSDYPPTFFCQRIEVTTARVQHARLGQFIDDVEHSLPFGWFVARRLELHMEVQPILPYFSE